MDHAPVYLDGLLRYQLSQPDVEQGTLNVRAIAGRLMGRRSPAFWWPSSSLTEDISGQYLHSRQKGRPSV